MKALIPGATGLLGQAVAAEARARGWQVRGAARRDAEIELDMADGAALERVLAEESPDLVFNCAALVDVGACEADPGLAYRINARPLAVLADWSVRTGKPFVHVSTDHFYPEGGSRPHDEDEPVRLVNEYARVKHAGDCLALTSPHALVLRTSIVGIRGWQAPSFAEWVIAAIRSKAAMTMFSDAWTSSIDVRSFASAAFDLIGKQAKGLVNLAAGEVYSKEQFIREMARQLGESLDSATSGSVGQLTPPRPSSLGLDVTRASGYLGRSLPGLEQVVAAVLAQHRESLQAKP